MKRFIALIMAAVMLLTIGGVAIMAEETDEAIGFTNKICTIKAHDGGYLTASGSEKGSSLTLGRDASEWRFKAFLGGKFAFIGEGDLACDVNGASKNEGVTIIQWTSTGAGNQRWILEEAGESYYIKSAFSELYMTEADGKITQEAKAEDKNQLWDIEIVGEFEPVVEAMLASDAAKSLSDYRYGRLYAYIMSGGEFNMLVYDKIEKMIGEKDYFNLTQDEQKAFVEECFTVVSTDLMYGSMATKLEPEVKVEYIGIKEGMWQDWHGIPENEARHYKVTISDESGESSFDYYSPEDNDEAYALEVGKAVGCFEIPIRRELKGFFYTSMNTSSWNGGDGNIWNNTAYKGDVNNMVQMFAHELGHVMDNGRVDNNVWYRAIAQDMVPVTGYGNTNRWEDLAEFSRMYLLARGDAERIGAIENTYPARTKAYKGLLYAIDKEYYKDYKDEYEKTINEVGDYTDSEIVTISLGDKYLEDKDGVLVLAEKRYGYDSLQNEGLQQWETYSRGKGQTKVINCETGRYLTFVDGKLSLGEEADLGFKFDMTARGYYMIQGSTGFAVNENFEVCVDGGAVWKIEHVGSIPFSGLKTIKSAEDGKALRYVDGVLAMKEYGTVWEIVPVDKGWYMIKEPISGKVFDISGNSTEDGASAILYSVTGGENQHFAIERNNDRTYSLVLRHSGLKLTEKDGVFFQGEGTRWTIENGGSALYENCADVLPNHWYYDVVRKVMERGWMVKERQSQFGADSRITRIEFVTALYRADGEKTEGTCSFEDVTGEEAENAVAWAEKNGIVNGMSSTTFAPNEFITREQIAAIFFRYAKYRGVDVSVGEDTNILSFTDFDQISEYAIPTMQWAVGCGLFKGADDGRLNPRDNTSRAEAAALLVRMTDEIVK